MITPRGSSCMYASFVLHMSWAIVVEHTEWRGEEVERGS